MTIFVSVVSYRDPDLESTLRDAVAKAAFPKNLHFGIVYQGVSREQPDFSFIPRYSLTTIHPKQAKGVGYARSLAMQMYADEDFYLQIDSHMQFIQHWDIWMQQTLFTVQMSDDYDVVLSSFPAPYHHGGINGSIVIPQQDMSDYPISPMKQKIWIRPSGDWGAERIEFNNPDAVAELAETVLGAFIFTYGSIVKDVPYDPEISFFGEEICFAMRAWTRGYNIYAPNKTLLYHFYGRHGHKRIWNDNLIRELSWNARQEVSRKKQERVLCGIEQGIYGAGNVRSLAEYEAFIGIDFKQHYGYNG